jgi:hypothetical protein
VDYFVYFRRLEATEYRLLVAMQQGKTLGQAVSHTFATKKNGTAPELTQIAGWFQNWAGLGWFCALKPKQPIR